MKKTLLGILMFLSFTILAKAEINIPTITIEEQNYTSIKLLVESLTDYNGYEVYRSLDGLNDWQLVREESSNDFVDCSLSSGQTYYYKVRWFIVAEERIYSEFSEVSSGTTKKLITPTLHLNDYFGDYSYYGVTININTYISSEATGYEIYRSRDNKNFTLVHDTALLQVNDGPLLLYTNYYYKARAYIMIEGAKVYSDYSLVHSYNYVLSSPPFFLEDVSYKHVKISFITVLNGLGYQLYRSTDNKNFTLLKTFDAGGWSQKIFYTDNSVKMSTKYYYKVRAYTVVEGKTYYGDFSWPIVVTPSIDDPNPTISTLYNTNTIKYPKVTSASGYEIYRSNDYWVGFKKIKTTTALSFMDKALKDGTTYYYKVRAYRVIGGKKYYGPYSYVLSTKIVLPAGKISLEPSASNAIRINITKVDATGYEIYRSTNAKTGFKKIKTTTALTFNNTALATNKTYYYKVRPYKMISGKKVYGKYSPVVGLKINKTVYAKEKLLNALRKEGFTCYSNNYCSGWWQEGSVLVYEDFYINEKTYYITFYDYSEGYEIEGSYSWQNKDRIGYSYNYNTNVSIEAYYNYKTKVYNYYYWPYDDGYTYMYAIWGAESAYEAFNYYLKAAGIKEADL